MSNLFKKQPVSATFFAVFLVVAIVVVPRIVVRIRDEVKLREVRTQIRWVEDFYTQNSHYPSRDLFKNRFPNFTNRKEYYSAYGLNNKDENPAQNFILRYGLPSWEPKSYALGHPIMDFGFSGYYQVFPCPRWSELGLTNPQVVISVSPGLIISDLNAGTVAFTLGKDQILLSGLLQPRIFQKEADKIVVTNGNDVTSYDYKFSADRGGQLLNPQKVGAVPKGCPDNYLN